MFKFSTDRRKYDLSKYKNLPIFHDIFEWVWSGHYGEDVTDFFGGKDKLGFTYNLELNINLNLSEDDKDSPFYIDRFMINLDKAMTLIDISGAIVPLKITKDREVKYFNVTLVSRGYVRELSVGVEISRDDIYEIFNGDKKDIALGIFSYIEDPDELYVTNLKILNFKYYKLRKDLDGTVGCKRED